MKTLMKVMLGLVAVATIVLVTPFGVVALSRGSLGAAIGLPTFAALPLIGLTVGALVLLARRRDG